MSVMLNITETTNAFVQFASLVNTKLHGDRNALSLASKGPGVLSLFSLEDYSEDTANKFFGVVFLFNDYLMEELRILHSNPNNGNYDKRDRLRVYSFLISTRITNILSGLETPYPDEYDFTILTENVVAQIKNDFLESIWHNSQQNDDATTAFLRLWLEKVIQEFTLY